MKLFAVLFNNDLSSPDIEKSLKNIKNINILWELNGGVKSTEVDISMPQVDAYNFYKKYMGYRLVIHDHFCDMPVSDGFIADIKMTEFGVSVMVRGFWFRHNDEFYNFDDTAQDTNQGALSYTFESNLETVTDDGQDFTPWIASGGEARYEINVTNDDDTIFWGFLGTKVSNTEIYVYEDYDLSTSGFNGATVDTNQGALSYNFSVQDSEDGNLSYTSDTFTDDVQNFADWNTASGNKAYIIVVTNGDSSESIGYLGDTVSATEIEIYQDLNGNNRGWAKDNSGGTPSSYNVYETPTFDDADQVFSDWGKQYRGTASYRIKVTNGDSTVSSAYLGDMPLWGSDETEIFVFQDESLTVPGWNRTSPTGKTPSSYKVVKIGTPASYEIIESNDYMTTSEVIKDALTNKVSAVSSNQDHIDETNTIIGFWEPPIDEGGLYPSELIDKMASMSDSSYNEWYYFLANQPFSRGFPKKPIPHFHSQTNDGSFDWKIKKWMASSNVTSERSIQEMRNKVKVIFREMEDDTLDVYPTESWLEDSDSQDDYWDRETFINGGDLTNAIAAQYGNLYLDKFKEPRLRRSVEITSPYILDDSNIRFPLWMPIKLSRGYFYFDVFPDYAPTQSIDGLRAAQATTMEYDYESNELRLVLDLEDERLDALLARMDAYR